MTVQTGYDYDLIDRETGDAVVMVRHLWPREPSECCMCGKPTFSSFCVPYYCGPVHTGQSEGGYAPACEPCYARWEKWDDGLTEFDSWMTVLRADSAGEAA